MWEKGWKAVAVHGPTSGIGNFDEDAWELYHVDEDRSEAPRPRRRAAGKAEGADRALVRGGGASTTCCRSTTASRSRSSWTSGPRPSRRGHLRLLPRHRGGAGGGRRQHPRPLVQDPGRGRYHEPRRRGRDLRPRLALRRPRAVPERPAAALRLQLPRHPARAGLRVRADQARPPRPRHGVHQGVAPASTASRTGRRGSTSTTRWSPRARCARSRLLHALRRRALRRPRLERRGQQPLPLARHRSRAARSRRSRSTSATTSTWTWRRRRWRRSPRVSRVSRR